LQPTYYSNSINFQRKLIGQQSLFDTGIACNCRHELNKQAEKFPFIDFNKYYVAPLPIERTWADGDVRARQILYLFNLIKSEGYEHIAVVSHGNIIKNIVALEIFKGTSTEELENCHAHELVI
jgi:hypothetical protein